MGGDRLPATAPPGPTPPTIPLDADHAGHFAAAPLMDRFPSAGSTLGRYRLIEEIGRGGMAVVYRAEDPALGREVAIKILRPRFWGDAQHAARFVREARAVARLRHVGIVEVHDFGVGEGDETPGFIVAELLEGPTLRAWLDQHGALLPEVAMIIASKLAEALEVAHAEGVIHRDLKPDNVILAEGRRVVLTDFGIARLLLEGESLTQTGALVGSPAYMSPEQARGAAVDERSDLFALGTLLYESSTGRLPFAGGDPIATAMCIVEGHYRPPQEQEGRVGRELAAVIARLLRTQPQERYPRATALVEDLRRLLAEVGLTALDDELASYLDGPRRYDEQLARRVVQRSLGQAEQAVSRGEVARALSLCDRVLAYRPDHRGALRLLEQLSARSARRRAAWVCLSVGLVLSGIVGGVWYARSSSSRAELAAEGSPTPIGPTAPVPDASATAAQTPIPDAAFDVERTTRAARRGRTGVPGRKRRRRPPPQRVAASAPPEPDSAGDPGPAGAGERDARVPPGPARLLIAIGPWCDAFVDGQAVGRSPMSRPLVVAPGTHRVLCRQRDGPTFSRTVRVEPGALKRVGGLLRSAVPVRLELSRGDAVRVNGRIYRGSFSLPPKRHRVDLLRRGAVVEGAWVTVSPGGCRLVDRPRLDCQESRAR